MAIFKFTYQTVMQMRNEIEAARKASVSYQVFNAEKIRKFYRNAKMRLSVADEKLTALQEKYCKLDENGKPIKLAQENGHVKLAFLDEAAETEFNVKYNDFITTSFDLEI